MFSIVEHLFIYLLPICMSFLEKSYIDPLPIFSKIEGFFFSIKLYESLVYFEYLSLSGYVVCKYFLSFHTLPFHFIMIFLLLSCRSYLV